ncbi:remorin 1.4 [Nicotiana tomentosiformis]|uniref:remorin 1.4 n=1 Tax=Nicotiana tomentosiformis TaxID=4098 RepID=UPI00051C2EE4|nr:remorin 1.4 [Nicotiana tomentosiformis]XP_009595350.1 remorin 1.4 [Nicotiana tomentosiformis]XP_033510825.1 remorin 1.4 [Nicotiana tomentosiformis]XP_033510826.1 remorin 1.4 [Nicotiana tomentosiformis]
MRRNYYDLGDGEIAAAIAASAFAIYSFEENAGSQYQTKTRGPVRPAEAAPTRRLSMQNGKTSPAITTITPAANDKIQNEISRGGRNAENKADAWEKAQTAKIRKRHDELLSALLAWENEKKMIAKQQMERRKNQLELAMKRNLQHYKNKLARIDHIAKGARTQAEEKRKYEESIVKEKSNKIRSTGNVSVKCFCF